MALKRLPARGPTVQSKVTVGILFEAILQPSAYGCKDSYLRAGP